MWTPCEEDSHNWQPIPNWMARYKCSKCYTIGFKGVIQPRFYKTSQMYEYKCKKCKGPTTVYKGKTAKPCPNCRGSSALSRPKRTPAKCH